MCVCVCVQTFGIINIATRTVHFLLPKALEIKFLFLGIFSLKINSFSFVEDPVLMCVRCVGRVITVIIF